MVRRRGIGGASGDPLDVSVHEAHGHGTLADRLGVPGLLAALALTGCDYAKQDDFKRLEAQYIATHDTLVSLWQAVEQRFKIVAIDTVSPPPRCIPPKCVPIPPLPARKINPAARP